MFGLERFMALVIEITDDDYKIRRIWIIFELLINTNLLIGDFIDFVQFL